MNNKTSFIKLIQKWGIVLLIVMGGSIVTLDITSSYLEFNSRSAQMRTAYVAQQKLMVKREVERVVALINHKKGQSEKLTKVKIKARVYEAYAIAQNIYQQNFKIKSDTEVKQMILDALRPFRFEQERGYFFIMTTDGTAVLSPAFPAFEGQNIINLQDSMGKYVVQEETELLQCCGEGFVEGYWPKPNTDEQHDYKKITFVKKLDIYDWSIGTGLYVDYVEEEIRSELLLSISTMRFGENGYIFVNRLNGDALVANGKCIVDTKKLWEVFNRTPEKTKDLFQKEYAAALIPAGDYIYYSISKLTTPDRESPKVSFIYGIPDLQWLIGAGVYLDDVDSDIAIFRVELVNQIKTKIIIFSLTVVAIVAFFIFWFRRLRQRLANDFKLFAEFTYAAADSSQEIDLDLIQFEELGQMAKNTNKVLHSLKQSEQYFRTLMEQSPLSIHIFDVNGLTVSVNSAWENLWQSSSSSIVGKYNCVEDKSLVGTEWHHHFLKVFSGTEVDLPEIEYDPAYIGVSGRKRIIKCLAFPITNNGEVERVVLMQQDVTVQRQAEEELQKVEKLESVGTLAGGIAHDFNNILMGVFGNVAMAKRKLAPDHPGMKYLEGAETSMARATLLTKQLLTFAKGGAPLKENVSIGQIIEEVVRFDLSGSKVKLVFEQADGLWQADADKGQIQQVLSNLTINAKQAMPDGGHLYVSLVNVLLDSGSSPDLRAGQYVKITVRDEGTGIDKKYLDRIFEPYFSTKQTGSGLGLASVYSIITKHDGSLSVKSQLGNGATFTIYLPAAKSHESVIDKPVRTEGLVGARSAKILVMDDEEVVCHVSSLLLGEIGFSSTTVADGEKALEMYEQAMQSGKPFDAVILDLTIPGGMGGEETIEKLLVIDPQVKAIVSSGYAEDPIMASYTKYGFKGIVSKPYSLDELQEVLTRVLNG